MATSINQSQLKTSNVVLQDILDITKDIVISADYSCFGSQVDGGAGFCIYLYGGTSLDTSIGSPDAGLGYEECNKIMPHNPDAYDEHGLCKNVDNLQSVIKKYLFLSNKELNYDTIKCKFIP